MPRALPLVRVSLVCGLAIASLAGAQSLPVRTVLAVHWSSEDFPSTTVVDSAIQRALLSNAEVPTDYFAEYLESDRFPSEDASLAFRDYIARKYKGRHIDVVMAISDPSLEFVLKHRGDLFPEAPIVASIAVMPDEPMRMAGAGLTGVAGGVAYDRTLALALTLHPSTKSVFVVAYAPTIRLLDRVRTELQPYSNRVELTYLEEPSIDRLLAAIRRVPAGSLVLYIRHSQEERGSVLLPSDVARLVSEASPVPVYGVSDSYMGSGVVGGVVSSREQLGARLGQMTRQILAGTRAQDMPMEPVALAATFDWRQLRRWGIDPSLLPRGSDIRFRELTVWEQYRWYMVGAGALMLVQSVLIGALLIQGARRRRVEAALRESEAHFRIVADTTPIMIWRSGVDKKCDFFNLPWLRFTGRSLEQELGDGWTAGVHPDDLPGCLNTYTTAFDAREPFEMEYRLRRFDGEYRWVFDTGIPRLEPNDVFVGYIGSCLDITDRKQAERALEETHAELSRVSRLTALGEFAASIAHEVRQPLTAIMINATACLREIERGKLDVEETRAALLDVVDASQRAEQVIQRNRELFRHHTVQALPLHINAVIREAVVLTANRLKNGQVTLTTTLADGLPTIRGDRIELEQVLLNLIANSVDALERVEAVVRRIHISSSLDGDQSVKVAVTDNGVGLVDVDVQRMFTLSYTTKATGTGVGLSISRSIVEAHGGRLWAEDNPQGGATFAFTLPSSDSAADGRQPARLVG
jgi:PAS domain S-box-containing protein